ncbi:hypothetical protein CDV31_015675 [Fusarium ambrosium]|uniref:EF-hand domain-containing protein n=1 Tax=Fusarium ambrosium TaxID=131363 RepID=A0A428SKU1_9HYPO|nr:hypothetical protein CDV31_015675 [Fusarium ambrosium]
MSGKFCPVSITGKLRLNSGININKIYPGGTCKVPYDAAMDIVPPAAGSGDCPRTLQLNRDIRKMFPHLEHLKSGKVDKEELERCIKAAWDAITLDEINSLIDSLPRPNEAVIRAKSWYTIY